MDYDIIICFETHVELKTRTKLFCQCTVKYDAPPNSRICPVCTGQPGALPVLNKRAVQYAVRVGLALNCQINRRSRFARKNYFYPDLPKGYQISQYELPFCGEGSFEIAGDDGRPYPVGIKRVHLEEDAGKLVHSSDSFKGSGCSLVDYNRSSVPLLEIVTDHERNPLRSINEARTYLEKLKQTLKFLDVSDCSMEKGQLRCDVNISLRPKGSKGFGNRAEIKNMASFKAIADALAYEIKRQAERLTAGETIPQETLLFDEDKGITLTMRSKEDAPDYRYFPDPDLLEIELDDEFIREIRGDLPELPDQKAGRLVKEFDILENDAHLLTKDRDVSDWFDACAPLCEDTRRLSRWIIRELFRLLNEGPTPMRSCPILPRDFSRLINLMARGDITDSIGRTVLDEMFRSGGSPDSVIEKRGLKPIKDPRLLEKILDEVVEENPEVLSRIGEGMTRPIDFLIGQVMKKTRGKADPKETRRLLEKKLLT
jgi:aspartyl-tRNA(Asn)/glutamyl-tRNA(Gln) amidotransferase subunit B